MGERLTYIPMTTTYKQSYGNVTNTRSRTDYARDFKDIVVTSIAPGGETEWSVRIPKFQRAPYTSFEASFVPVLCGNDFYMVYNDNLSNLKLVEEGSFASLDYTEANSGLFIVKIDADGNVEKDLLSSYKDVGGSFCLQGSVMLNNNKLLIPVTKMLKGTVKYAEVDFKPSKQ
ncbi:MAG: hypothetical protein M0D57_11885 [Sphingobacteriales bacterium JAD_PAG50586_3]|nr:MAG: hypothetical protein M0D57_11885 [Sphingobacteriales bacterium JAD_PAG50586_3]